MSATSYSTASVTYLIAIRIFLGIHACASSAVGRHGLVMICPVIPFILHLAVVHALDNLGTDEGTFCDDSFK